MGRSWIRLNMFHLRVFLLMSAAVCCSGDESEELQFPIQIDNIEINLLDSSEVDREVCSGQAECCTEFAPCRSGEGDCREDNQCYGQSVCGQHNCPTDFGPLANCCVCKGEDACCTGNNPCQAGEGDCDEDMDCAGDLTCGTDNCQTLNPDNYYLYDPTDDCCQ